MSDIVKFNKDNTFQRLRAAFLDPDNNPISDVEQTRLDRVVLLFTLRFRNKYSKHQAISKIINQYTVSQATAYRDYTMMTNLFGELDEVNHAAEMMFVREEYMFLYRKMIEDRDWTGAKQLLDKYKETIPVVDENEVDKDKLSAHEFHLTLDRQLKKMMKDQLINEGGMDFAKYPIEDIEFVEVKKDNDGSSQ